MRFTYTAKTDVPSGQATTCFANNILITYGSHKSASVYLKIMGKVFGPLNTKTPPHEITTELNEAAWFLASVDSSVTFTQE